MAIGHHINDRSHVIEKEMGPRGEMEERQEFVNMDEGKCSVIPRRLFFRYFLNRKSNRIGHFYLNGFYLLGLQHYPTNTPRIIIRKQSNLGVFESTISQWMYQDSNPDFPKSNRLYKIKTFKDRVATDFAIWMTVLLYS